MCNFCDTISKNNFVLEERSTYAEDNICEFVNNLDCNLCESCLPHFELFSFQDNYKERSFIQIGYYKKVFSKNSKVIVHPFSESIQINYCPFCGEKISKHVVQFENNDNIYHKE